MKFIFLLFLILYVRQVSAKVQNPIVFEGFHSSAGSFIHYNDYSDIRVLDTSRKKIAYWMIKKGSLSVEQYFENGSIRELRLTYLQPNAINSVVYKYRGGKLALERAVKSFPKAMTYSLLKSPANACQLREEAFSQIKGITSELDTSACSKNLDDIIIDPICKSVLPPEEFRSLKRSYLSNLYMEDGLSKAAKCLEKPETKKTLALAYDITDMNDLQTQLEIIESKFKLNASLFFSAPETLSKKVTCDWNATGVPTATTDQSGKTTYYRKKGASPSEIRPEPEFKRYVMHELFHGPSITNVINEDTTKDLVSICNDGATTITRDGAVKKAEVSTSVKKRVNLIETAYTDAISASIGQKEYAPTVTTKITNDIAANIAVPDTVPASSFAPAPAALAQTVFDSGSPAAVSQPDYANTYARVAMQQAMPALKSAQSLLAAARSVALPMAYASGSPSNNRAPASSSNAAIFIRPTSASAAAAVTAGAESTSASEVSAASLATSGEDLPTGIARKSLKASRSVASAEVGSRSQNESGGAITSSGSVRGVQGSGGSDGSSSSGSSAGGSYTPSQGSHGKRRAASVDPKEQQSILQLLNRPESYRITKKKLEDADFVQKLKNNGIAIFRNDGSVKGDPSGSIKYSDKGNRFVRED